VDAGCRDLGHHQETVGRGCGDRDHYRRQGEHSGVQRPGQDRDVQGPGGSAHLLSRRAANAFGDGERVIKPLAQDAIPLIQWSVRNIGDTRSRVVLTGMPTCANCHSISLDGKTMGMDLDGPQNDKGLYALAEVKPRMSIRNQDTISWNPSQDKQFGLNRVGSCRRFPGRTACSDDRLERRECAVE